MSDADEALIHAAIVADVMRHGEAAYWERRAEDFDWAKPRLGESHGRADRAELSARWNRCHAAAVACRNRARLLKGAVA